MFKKGDKVRCVDNVGLETYLTLGKIYTVDRMIDDRNTVVILSDDKDVCYYLSDRFELVEKSNSNDNDEFNINAVLGEAVFRGESTLTVNGVTFKVIKV